ncbi:MAG: hypothetical protein ACM3NQ_01535 [Bacteroidales bacterium]
MNRLNRAVLALAVCGGLFAATPLFAQAAAAPAQKDQAATATKFISPIRGDAEIQVLPTKTVVKGNMVITTIEIKNISNAPIAGLKVEEFWFDKSGNPAAGGDTQRAKKPIMPQEIYTFTLQTEKDPGMNRNTYQFSHSYGKVRTKQVKKF